MRRWYVRVALRELRHSQWISAMRRSLGSAPHSNIRTMKPRPVRMVLAAQQTAGVRALRQVISHESVELVAVIAAPEARSRGATVAQAAALQGLPVWAPQALRDPATANRLRDLHVDVLLNVHSLVLVDERVLAAPRLGSFNLHPGPLPRYAGLNSPCWAVYRREHEFGATLHRMTAAIDAGPIVDQVKFGVEPRETGLSLTTKTVGHQAAVLEGFLAQIGAAPDGLPAREQDLSQREYLGAGPPHGGRLQWQLPAADLDAFVRACDFGPFASPWGHPLVYREENELAVRTAEAIAGSVSDAPPGTVVSVDDEGGASVSTGDGLLRLGTLEVAGQTCASSELLRPGDIFTNR
jgi:methionyl-tRNA formyltransferase